MKVNTHVSNNLNMIASSECFVWTICFIIFLSQVLFGVQYPMSVAAVLLSKESQLEVIKSLPNLCS